jgi:hypothetical protein
MQRVKKGRKKRAARRHLNHCVSAPTLLRTIRAFCQCCGFKARYCAMVLIREGFRRGWWFGPIVMCAQCRERHVNRWTVAPGWHDRIGDERDRAFSPGEWEEWCRENPPLKEILE